MIARLWKNHRWLLIAFVVAAALSVFFGVRTVMFTLYWSDPANRDQAIAGWMTPRYVAHSWHVPPEVVQEALGLTGDGAGRRVTLDELATARGIDTATLGAELDAAIAAFRASERPKP